MASLSSRTVHLSPLVKKFLTFLDKQRKLDFQAALVQIGVSIDDGPGVSLGFPYQPYARCWSFRGFWIVYRIMPNGAVHVGTATTMEEALSLAP